MMNRKSLIALACSAPLFAASPALAQQSACVSLLVGAGYCAWMGVKSGRFFSGWSPEFCIGRTQCVSLSDLANGAQYSVLVKAALGKTATCQPASSAYNSSYPNSVTYLAWGTTLSVQCKMPTADILDRIDKSVMPSKEGLDAAERVRKEGPTVPPS